MVTSNDVWISSPESFVWIKNTSFLTLSSDHIIIIINYMPLLVCLSCYSFAWCLRCFLWICCPCSSLSSCQPCAARWAFHTALLRARPDWADWCTERHALLLPSHRLTREYNELNSGQLLEMCILFTPFWLHMWFECNVSGIFWHLIIWWCV